LEVVYIRKIKQQDLVQLIRHYKSKGYSLEKTIELLDTIGSYDKTIVYRNYKSISTDNTDGSENQLRERLIAEKNLKKKRRNAKLIGSILIIFFIVVILVAVINQNNQNRKEEIQDNIRMYIYYLEYTITDMEKGMLKVKEGFKEYVEKKNPYASIDSTMYSYIKEAESDWENAEIYLSKTFEYMSVLKELLDDEIYNHFVEMYASVNGYRESISPYGKSYNRYSDDVDDATIKLKNEISKFKSRIFSMLN